MKKLALAAACLLTVTACGDSPPRVPMDAAVEQVRLFHRALNERRFEDIEAMAESDAFEAGPARGRFREALELVRDRLGSARGARRQPSDTNTNGDAVQVIARFQTDFERCPALETFTFEFDGSRPVLMNYNINSVGLEDNPPSCEGMAPPEFERDRSDEWDNWERR